MSPALAEVQLHPKESGKMHGSTKAITLLGCKLDEHAQVCIPHILSTLETTGWSSTSHMLLSLPELDLGDLVAWISKEG